MGKERSDVDVHVSKECVYTIIRNLQPTLAEAGHDACLARSIFFKKPVDKQKRSATRAAEPENFPDSGSPPLQPERKPFIERALGTFSHDLLELLLGFCGRDVSDRQAIRSRRSFSARFGQGENAEGRLTPEAFQEFCDKWCALYASRPHQGLGGLTPTFRASNWIGLVRMIEDERALDILLCEPAEGGVRTVHKKGISVCGMWQPTWAPT